jgi:hypothetical protein
VFGRALRGVERAVVIGLRLYDVLIKTCSYCFKRYDLCSVGPESARLVALIAVF